MKSIFTVITFCLLLFLFPSAKAQITPFYQWAWVKGDNSINQTGIYGTLGTAAASNKPGARIGSVSLTDAAGNLWLFGGNGYDASAQGYLNDLWKYNPANNEWTWVKGDNTINQTGIYGTLGTAAAPNKPGARKNSVSWKDAAGNFWLFGGLGYAASGGLGYLNDLWKYDPANNEWTWVKGDNITDQTGIYGTQGTGAVANKPGARENSISWTDAAGNLWLFGGYGNAASVEGYLNDLWKYNPTNNRWTWVKGDNIINQLGIYGTQGTAAAANKPGARQNSVSWTDASGNFWLFGGQGYPASGGQGHLNDVWKYNLANNDWTWLKGDSIKDQQGIYGTQGTAAATNKPGGRTGSVGWTDTSGNFSLFGGYGIPASVSIGLLNDFWKYNPANNEWTWVKGDNITYQNGIYGTQGTVAATNKPGARQIGVSWTDTSGNFWLFGGFGRGPSVQGNLNDLWKFSNTVYKFTGNGDWDIAGNWLYSLIGPKNIPGGLSVSIDNISGGQCDITGNINIQVGGQLTIEPTKKLNIINGNLTNAGLLNGSGTLTFSGLLSALSSSGSILTPIILSNKQVFLTGNTNTNAIQLLNGSKIRLDNFDLKMNTGTLVADNLNYIITNSTGRLNRVVAGVNPVLFPVGNSNTSYTPATIVNTGTSDIFMVRVIDGVTTTGLTNNELVTNRLTASTITTGNVNLSWEIQENIAGGSDASLTLQWNQTDEQDGFNRNQSFISHLLVCPPPDPPLCVNNRFYDAVAPTAATGSNPYTQARANVTNFETSTFIVTSGFVYSFTNAQGDQNWNNPLNWSNGQVPPNIITTGREVVIDPVSGQCNFTGTLTVQAGGKLTVMPGKKLNIIQ